MNWLKNKNFEINYYYTFRQILIFIWIGSLIAFEYSSFVYFIITYIFQISIFLAFSYFLFFSFCVICIYISYYKSIFLNPGFLNKEEVIIDELEYDEIINNSNDFTLSLKILRSFISIQNIKINFKDLELKHQKLYEYASKLKKNEILSEMNKIYFENINNKLICKTCKIIKLPRTHHCKICKKCVKRMDHHCPFTANCVGEYNTKDFIRFLFYSSFTLFFLFFNSLFFYCFNSKYEIKLTFYEENILKSAIGISIILALAIGSLFKYQIINAIKNITTIEDHIDQMNINNPFNLGKNENLKNIFGSNKFFYILNPLN